MTVSTGVRRFDGSREIGVIAGRSLATIVLTMVVLACAQSAVHGVSRSPSEATPGPVQLDRPEAQIEAEGEQSHEVEPRTSFSIGAVTAIAGGTVLVIGGFTIGRRVGRDSTTDETRDVAAGPRATKRDRRRLEKAIEDGHVAIAFARRLAESGQQELAAAGLDKLVVELSGAARPLVEGGRANEARGLLEDARASSADGLEHIWDQVIASVFS